MKFFSIASLQYCKSSVLHISVDIVRNQNILSNHSQHWDQVLPRIFASNPRKNFLHLTSLVISTREKQTLIKEKFLKPKSKVIKIKITIQFLEEFRRRSIETLLNDSARGVATVSTKAEDPRKHQRTRYHHHLTLSLS